VVGSCHSIQSEVAVSARTFCHGAAVGTVAKSSLFLNRAGDDQDFV